jgi:hypothetical protein
MDINNFQRVGSASNSQVGRDFEEAAQMYFEASGLKLRRNFGVQVGFATKKNHNFDLGSDDPPILVECKSFTWTVSGNTPSAKIRGMNEVMLYFNAAPAKYKKILFLLKHHHSRRTMSLAAHYVKNHEHLLIPGVEVWEFDLDTKQRHLVFG